MPDVWAERRAAATRAAVGHYARRAGLEQRTAQEIRGDNSFVALWLDTFMDAKRIAN